MTLTKQQAAAAIALEWQGGRITEDDAASLLALVTTMPEAQLELVSPTATATFIIKFLRRLEGGNKSGGVPEEATAASSSGGGAGVGSTAEPVTITIVVPGLFKGHDPDVYQITIKDQADFKEFMRLEGCGGLIFLETADGVQEEDSEEEDGQLRAEGSVSAAEQREATGLGAVDGRPAATTGLAGAPPPRKLRKGQPLVRDFAELVPRGVYALSNYTSRKSIEMLRGEAQHLQQAREDESARALRTELDKAEPSEGYVLREDLRMLKAKDGKEYEHDAVVVGATKAYVGSFKTFVRGAKPVKAIANRAAELGELSEDPKYEGTPNGLLPRDVRPAFMAEKIEPATSANVIETCRRLGVVRLQRSGGALHIANSIWKAGSGGALPISSGASKASRRLFLF